MPSVKSSWITRFSARRRARLLRVEEAIGELERAQWASGRRYPFTTLSTPPRSLRAAAPSYRER
jgi:hypothetical protein